MHLNCYRQCCWVMLCHKRLCSSITYLYFFRLFRPGLLSRAKLDTANASSWLDTLGGLLMPEEMKYVNKINIPVMYEQHIHEYRRFLSGLSLEAVLKEPVTLLPPIGTQQYHKNVIHPLEVFRMNRVSKLIYL